MYVENNSRIGSSG